MCELFGFSSYSKTDLTPLLREFYSHSRAHPSGWGLAVFDGGKAEIHTEPVAASDSMILPKLLANRSTYGTTMAHIRLATVGGISSENCHPFVRYDATGRRWTLIHNGTVFNGVELLKYHDRQNGDTDSERILMYIVDGIESETVRNGGPLSPYLRFMAVERAVECLSLRNKLNFIIYDGEQMYVHVNMRYTLYTREDEHGAYFATVPLDRGCWRLHPLNTLHVYQGGKLIFKGRDHHNEYVDPIAAAVYKLDFNI